MAYKPEVLRESIDRRDRDAAPYFAGRAAETERFERALRSLSNRRHNDRAAEFLIYQGAPGCGKTSLAKHLDDTHADALFVQLAMDHLYSAAVLEEKIVAEALASARLGRRGALLVLRAAGEWMKMRDAASDLAAHVSPPAAKNARIVLHLDEAQTVGSEQQSTLTRLHTVGANTPCILLMTGLTHTAGSIRKLPGLSRIASEAIVNMGAMTDGECAESTRMMLDAAGVRGDIVRASELSAPLAMGWPQHLKGVQDALAREVQRVGGDADQVDHLTVNAEATRFRSQYYEARLDDSILAKRPAFTHRLIAKIHESKVEDEVALHDLCAGELARCGLADNPAFGVTAKTLVTTLVEKGVVTIIRGRGCEVAIPSMAVWAAEQTDGSLPHRPQPAGSADPRPRAADVPSRN